MTPNTRKEKVVIVSIYFGNLPNYFNLWLASCAKNKEFTWLFITDSDLAGYEIPSNVIAQQLGLCSIQKMISNQIGFEASLTKPYKLCDYRPIYWTILDNLSIDYDFWGSCDIDVLFGNLCNFVTPEIFSKYDRIFGLGHLSIIRSSPIAKLVFSLKSPAPSWKSIFSDQENFGFDEHHGVNRTWNKYPLRYYENEVVVADIDPQFREFRLTQVPLNKPQQIFYYEDGRIFQGYFDGVEQWKTREFAYIHFQKRKMVVPDGILESSRILIGPAGFSAMPLVPAKKSDLNKLHGVKELGTSSENMAKLRTSLRYYRRKFIRA